MNNEITALEQTAAETNKFYGHFLLHLNLPELWWDSKWTNLTLKEFLI